LALDIGEIHAGEAKQAISEVEIELKAGAPEFLFDLATQLLEQAPLSIEPRSKAERGYILSGAITPSPIKVVRPEISAQQSADEAWNAVMQAALVQCVANVPGFIENAHDTEYLHQLRIALRRLRTGVSLAKALGQTTPDWDQSLRETMRGLNPARDWDVFLHETLPGLLAALSATHDEEAMLGLLRAVAAQTRQQAQTLVLSAPFTQLILGIGRSLLAVPADASTPSAQAWMARQWAAKVLEKRWLILRKRCRSFAKLNPAERHMARIAAKKMRYAADAFAPLYDKRGGRFIAALAKLQSALGRANDAHIGMQLLRALPKKSAAISFDLGRIDGALEFEAARHANVSGAIWRQLAQARLFWR
jgi:CHAD domain-containing protein